MTTTENSRADALTPCAHADDPKACYRVRCQLGGKCVDDEMSPRQPAAAPIDDKLERPARVGGRNYVAGELKQQVLGRAYAEYDRWVHSASACKRCGATTAQACNDVGCFYLESGDGEPAPSPADERAARAEAALRALADECENDAIAGWEERMRCRIDDANRVLARAAPSPADERVAFEPSAEQWEELRLLARTYNEVGFPKYARKWLARSASANETGAEKAKRGTPEQIQVERKLTCEAIDGAIAFGYQNTNPPPSADHWLAPYWHIGRKQAELESRSPAMAAEAPEELPHWFEMFLTNVCELPDRNSPEGEPDAVVATLDELRNCALNAIEQCVSYAAPQPAQADTPAEAHETITCESMLAAIDEFELVGDNNIARDLSPDEKFAVSEFIISFFENASTPAQADARVGLTDALRRAREELSTVEWENDPPSRVVKLFDEIDALLAAHPGQPEPASPEDTSLSDRLIWAIEGECDGLAISGEQASNILAYLQYGAAMGDAVSAYRIIDQAIGRAEDDEQAVPSGDLRIVTLRLDNAKVLRSAIASRLPEPRAEVTDCGCETNEACKMKTDGSCWRAD